ncbi:MAG: sensor histidine kinase [Lachnospiraceae bacterium]
MKNEVMKCEGTKRSSKKLTGSLAAKVIAICLVIISAFMCVASAAAVIVADYMNVYSEDEATVLTRVNEQFLDRYSVYAMANYKNGNKEAVKELDQTNFRFGIIRTDDYDAVDLNDPKNYVVSNIDRAIDRNDVNLYSCNWSEYTYYSYDMSLFGYGSINNYGEQGAYTCESQAIDGYFYDWMNETLYIKVGERLYPYIGEILVKYPDSVGYTDHTFLSEAELNSDAAQGNDANVSGTSAVTETAGEVVDEADEVTYLTQEAPNVQEVEDNTYLVQGTLSNSYLNGEFTEWRRPDMLLMFSNSSQYLRASDVRVIDDRELLALGELNADGYSVDYVSAGMATVPVVPKTDETEVDSYYIVSYAKDPLDVKADFNDCDLLAQGKLLVDFAFAYKYVFVLLLALSLVAGIAAFVFLLCAAGHRNGVEELCKRPWDAIPVDVNICGVLCIDALLACAVIYVGTEWNPLKYISFWLFTGAAGILAILLLIECSMSFALWCKLGKWWRHTLVYACAKLCWKIVQTLWQFICRLWNRFMELMHSVRFLWKAWLILGGIAFAEFLVIVMFASGSGRLGLFLIFWFLEKLLLYPMIIFGLLQMYHLQEGGKTLAQGDLESKIDTSRMYWEFKKHGDHLNAIGDGMNAAVAERMKSERFKTELITNVSHDIKTPLTSIINYVDLLGKEQLDNPKAQEYLDVLSRQSARLKKLIEDLIEASKASTGNLKVAMEVCDAQVTLVQTIGEYEEKLSQGQIELQIRKPDEPVRINADSRHLWRVFDNLMNNICKYAQPGTRAYVNLEREGDQARITFRNISREPLNISSEELMERFVRGDSSRSMEGNGLGLSIARSLTELMGGSLELTVDGDLFKVVLTFPVLNN